MKKKNKKLFTLLKAAPLFTALLVWGCDTEQKIMHKVSYLTNAAAPAYKSEMVTEGEQATRPEAPKRTGHAFADWHWDLGLKKPFDFNVEITSNTKAYAKWIANGGGGGGSEGPYVVSYVTNEAGAVWSNQTVASGSKISSPIRQPWRSRYFLVGWYKDTELKQAFNFATDTITTNTALYAKWRRGIGSIYYGITFHNGFGYLLAGLFNSGNLLLKIDFAAGSHTIVSGRVSAAVTNGSGPALKAPVDLIIHNGAAYVTDAGLDAVVKVDLANGNRSYVSKDGVRGTGPALSSLGGITFHNGAAYVTDNTLKAVLKVDLASGNRSYVSKDGVRGTGPALSYLGGTTFHNGAAYVTDTGLDAVLKVDLANGNRNIISSSSRGSGFAFHQLSDIAYHNGSFYVYDKVTRSAGWYDAGIIKVNPANGNRELFSRAGTTLYGGEKRGVGPEMGEFVKREGMDYHSGALYLSIMASPPQGHKETAVIKVDLATGNRTVVFK